MTWGEFKKALEDAGVTDDCEIFYIDVHMPDTTDELCIGLGRPGAPEDLGISVGN